MTEKDKGKGQEITPETRVGPLLEAYPALEETLIAMSPAFAKLRNPVLRRTVARVATLRQVARLGEVPLSRLIGELRAAAGQEGGAEVADEPEGGAARPDWLRLERVVKTLDARPIIDGGGHPMAQVMKDLLSLEGEQLYELITPFVPAPLIERAREKGYEAWSEELEPGLVRTWFRKV